MSIKEISNSAEDIKTLQAIAKQTFTETFGSQNTAEDLAKFLNEEYDFDKLKAEVENPESFYYFYYFEDELAGYLKLNVGAAQTESELSRSVRNSKDIRITKISRKKNWSSYDATSVSNSRRIKETPSLARCLGK